MYAYKIRGFYSDRFHNNFLHTQTMTLAIVFESIISILAAVQHDWQCISWLILILQKRHFQVKIYENVSEQDRCIDIRHAFVIL